MFHWSDIPKHMNPTLFSIGPIEIRWYGLMYIVAFLIVYTLVLYRIKTEKLEYTKQTIIDFIFWAILGVLIGGRLGYVLFYDFQYFVSNPLRIISPFNISNGFHYTGLSGMSYHGGMIGLFLVLVLFCRKNKMDVLPFADLFIPTIPLGYTFGRIGNFVNGELYGRITTVPWGMYFPLDATHQLRHPSQLYEAFSEGILLFIILWSLRKTNFFDGFLLSLYLIGYGLVRILIEFVREPDSQLGFILGPFTMGQIFCACMILGGTLIMMDRGSRSRQHITKGLS